jgi:hypothetical protein
MHNLKDIQMNRRGELLQEAVERNLLFTGTDVR